MCLDLSREDSLGSHDQDVIADRCSAALPAHALAIRSNEDGLTWAVLTPPALTPELLRFTICRVSPAVMVMIEDHAARRQFRGLSTIEDAVEFVCQMAGEALQGLVDGGDDTRTVH